jgi:hypothetical protein
LRGGEQSRRDDLEALGYVWVYLLKGSLPWMGAKGLTEEAKQARTCQMKSDTPIEELCKDLPEEFGQYLRMVRELEFTESPKYSELRALFRNRFMREGFVYDYQYDWVADQRQEKGSQITNETAGRRRVSRLVTVQQQGTVMGARAELKPKDTRSAICAVCRARGAMGERREVLYRPRAGPGWRKETAQNEAFVANDASPHE